MIFFYGHSLDSSDKDYINEVFDFIGNLKTKIKQIIIIYRSKNSKSKLLMNLILIRGKNEIEEFMKNNNLLFLEHGSKQLELELNKEINIASFNSIR